MQLHEAKELIEAFSFQDANTAIEAGWTLLAVVSGQESASNALAPVYVLGMPDTAEDRLRKAQDKLSADTL